MPMPRGLIWIIFLVTPPAPYPDMGQKDPWHQAACKGGVLVPVEPGS